MKVLFVLCVVIAFCALGLVCGTFTVEELRTDVNFNHASNSTTCKLNFAHNFTFVNTLPAMSEFQLKIRRDVLSLMNDDEKVISNLHTRGDPQPVKSSTVKYLTRNEDSENFCIINVVFNSPVVGLQILEINFTIDSVLESLGNQNRIYWSYSFDDTLIKVLTYRVHMPKSWDLPVKQIEAYPEESITHKNRTLLEMQQRNLWPGSTMVFRTAFPIKVLNCPPFGTTMTSIIIIMSVLVALLLGCCLCWCLTLSFAAAEPSTTYTSFNEGYGTKIMSNLRYHSSRIFGDRKGYREIKVETPSSRKPQPSTSSSATQE